MSIPGIAEGFTDQGRHEPDNFYAGEFPRVVKVISIAGTAPLVRGSVLGRVTDSGVYQLSLAAATDGSEVPDAILRHDVDPTSGYSQAHAVFAGEVNQDMLVLGEGHTLASITEALRQKSVFLRSVG